MSLVDDALHGARVVIEVPRSGVTDWVAIAEVLLQEGLNTWALPPSLFDQAPEILAIHGRRARVGACGVTDADGLRAAVDAGLTFVLSPVLIPDAAAHAHGVPVLGGALTPGEVAEAARAGHDAVTITPVDALGGSYARTLPAMFPELGIVPWGRLERYQAEMWLDAGAAAAVVSEVVLRTQDSSPVNSPEEVARRAGSFAKLLGN